MKVVIDSYAWLNKADLGSEKLEALRKVLTINPRKVGDHPGEPPRPIRLFSENAATIGLPRQYFMAHRKPAHEVEFRTTDGDKRFWPGSLRFAGELRPEQDEAKKKVMALVRSGSLGGLLRAPPGWGKCLVKSRAYITDLSTGKRGRIEEFEGLEPLVSSLKGTQVLGTRAARVWSSGRKQCARLELASGQWLEASWDHPVLTTEGYRSLDLLRVGDLVACARSAPKPEKLYSISDSEVVVAAMLIADGALTQNKHIYINGDRQLVDEFRRCVVDVPGFTGFGVEIFRKGAWYVSFLGLNSWMCGFGINCLSKNKRVPSEFFGLSDFQLALFLNRLFTDGNVYTGSPSKIELCLASEGLIDDVQELLRRFSVIARKSFRKKFIKAKDGTKKFYSSWRLQIADATNQLRFLNAIGSIIGKEAACEVLRSKAEGKIFSTNWDVVPVSVEAMHEITRSTGKQWTKGTSVYRNGMVGRDTFIRACERIGYSGPHRRLADMDVVWERVISVTSIGEQDVYDLTVPETGNVIANGIVVHNTIYSCALIAELQLPTLIVVHKEFLMNQWRERIEQFLPGASIGQAQGSVCDFKGRHIVVGMMQSLAEKDYGEEFRLWPGLLISDECHRIGAGTWSVVPTYFPARVRLGLSATIRRKDGADNVFYYHLGNILFAAKEQRLKPKIRRVWTKFDLVQTPYFNPSLATKNQVLKALCASTMRNTLIVEQLILAVKAGRKVLVLSERLQHLDDMESLLYKLWKDSDGPRPSVGFYIGACTEEELEVAEGCQVIFATSQLVQEGLDIPALDTVFLTCPMSDVEQAVGRILRVFPGKRDPIVVDFRDDAVSKCVKAARYRDQFYSRVA